jgi:hypothetical protein
MPRSRKHGAMPLLPNTPSWRGAHLKHRDNFTLTFYLTEVTLAGKHLERKLRDFGPTEMTKFIS